MTTGTLQHRVHPFAAGRPDRQVFQRITTEHCPPDQRYDYWRSTVIRAAVADEPSPEQRRDFYGTVMSLANEASEFHQAQFDQFSARRSEAAARRDDGEDPALFYFCAGAATVEEAGDVELQLTAGDFTLFNPLRATTVAFERSSVVQLDLPRHALLSRLGAIPGSRAIATALRASPMAPMLRAQLDTLSQILSDLSPAEQMTALEATQALALTILESALARGSGSTGLWGDSESPDERRLGLLTAAQRYIDQHIAHPALDADTIAHALHCSRSTLYRAFASQGLGIREYIREQRLQRLRKLLQEANPTTTIGDLAAQCGLYDAPNLSRMFRARFGISPSEFRSNSFPRQRRPSYSMTRSDAWVKRGD